MGMKTKFKRFFELEDDVQEFEEFVDEPEQRYEEEPKARRSKGHSQSTQSTHFQSGPKQQQGQNVVSLQSVKNSSKVILFEPRTYDEAQEIADHLKARKAVIINLQRISHEQAKRIVDFLSGTVYAIGGDIQKLGGNIFLCTPDNVDVSGTITDMVQEHFRN
ncbi:cell division protein SepF [Alkalihalobacillus alcalophilus ATCC 27647 = CGMCC 1.3604]|uniref:Cell division protein SepF n=1 Tax=Alkalihalobacillus alcalophilus ATCC 27647 = CGMCC 1.3604 TaxID=1218173 RepID=A0A094WP67_ALKAL|nr:cell division protein SepF [Alkalihalobacillus alcalophilus]KGA97768.1 cell division protein SepF [Alkalihalobacillus alcalophilus ATCC 27647 = CGMCC 1.3604]MED1563124.1 cell division protein SepF [Alkalihalobacillus alcalophilus]THG89254.1 cell division protein SepF [Alkalihalobacillus alcalophilus ATCC 27647 = CGMCC 1.3604]